MTSTPALGRPRHLGRQLFSRVVEVLGGVLLAVSPFYPWVHASSPAGLFTVTVSLHDYTTWAWVLTALGATAALVSLVPGQVYRALGRITALAYCLIAVAAGLSLLRATGVGSGSELGYGAFLALGGWLALLAGGIL